MNADALVADYLGRLEAAAWPLPPERRTELASEVREHIEAALSEAGSRDEVTIRNVLDRLGRPEEIVAGEAAGTAPAAPVVSVSVGPTTARVGAVEMPPCCSSPPAPSCYRSLAPSSAWSSFGSHRRGACASRSS